MIGIMALAVAAAASDPRCAARVDFFQPPRGMISTPSMASKIAETYFNAIFGARTIRRELPLKVSIQRGVWHVEGHSEPLEIGGVAEIDLCRSNGLVLHVAHGQ